MANAGGGGTLGRWLVVNWFHHIFLYKHYMGHELYYFALSVLPQIVVSISPFLIICLIIYPSVHDTIPQTVSCDCCWLMRSYGYHFKTCEAESCGLIVLYSFILSHLIVCYASWIGKFLQWQFKRALPRHFCCFPAETEKSFFLTFIRAGHIALKFINLLINEMAFIRKLKPPLNVQTNSIRAKVSTWRICDPLLLC